jgi:capsular exopolysaccharide synthesis family protein
MIARTFDLEGQVGLTSVLTSRIAHGAALQRTRFSNLDVLASGPVPPNPSELLASENMRKLLEAVASEYDLVLVDTPPLIPVTDAAVASRYCDGTIMVCRHELVKRDEVTAGADSLRKAEAELLGLIYNGAKATEPLAASHYYTHAQSRDGFGETSSRSPEHGGDARPTPHRRPGQTVR